MIDSYPIAVCDNYRDYTVKDLMREAGIELLPLREENSLHPIPALIERLLPKSIHATSAKGNQGCFIRPCLQP